MADQQDQEQGLREEAPPDEKRPPACIDCRWYYPAPDGTSRGALCMHEKTQQFDRVRGFYHPFAAEQREPTKPGWQQWRVKCGPDGQWFEPKPPASWASRNFLVIALIAVTLLSLIVEYVRAVH